MLRYETPALYDLIFTLTPKKRKIAPPVELISLVCSASGDPAFDKPRFSRYLDEYKQKGLRCGRGKPITPEREAYYEVIRKRKLAIYIEQHRQEIELFRSGVFDTEEIE